MEFEKPYNRNILKAIIDKQIYRCTHNEYYIFGILVSTSYKFKLIDSMIKEILKLHFGKCVKLYQSTPNGIRVEFINGSRIDCIVAMESYRGKRYHALVIDNNIEDELKYGIGYCKFIDYPNQFRTGWEDRILPEPKINNKSDIIEVDIQ